MISSLFSQTSRSIDVAALNRCANDGSLEEGEQVSGMKLILDRFIRASTSPASKSFKAAAAMDVVIPAALLIIGLLGALGIFSFGIGSALCLGLGLGIGTGSLVSLYNRRENAKLLPPTPDPVAS